MQRLLLNKSLTKMTAGSSVRKVGRFLSTNKVECSKVVVKGSTYGDGAFAACNIKAGEMIEVGIVRRLTNINGHENPYILTWSDDLSVWAAGSGASTFYNHAEDANTIMHRYYEEDRFEFVALKDIAEGKSLHTHTGIKNDEDVLKTCKLKRL